MCQSARFVPPSNSSKRSKDWGIPATPTPRNGTKKSCAKASTQLTGGGITKAHLPTTRDCHSRHQLPARTVRPLRSQSCRCRQATAECERTPRAFQCRPSGSLPPHQRPVRILENVTVSQATRNNPNPHRTGYPERSDACNRHPRPLRRQQTRLCQCSCCRDRRAPGRHSNLHLRPSGFLDNSPAPLRVLRAAALTRSPGRSHPSPSGRKRTFLADAHSGQAEKPALHGKATNIGNMSQSERT